MRGGSARVDVPWAIPFRLALFSKEPPPVLHKLNYYCFRFPIFVSFSDLQSLIVVQNGSYQADCS